MTTDPIADMLTRIRNVNMVRQEYALVPWSKMKVAVAKVLKEEGFIRDFEVLRGKPTRTIKIYLKYKERNQPSYGAIHGLTRALLANMVEGVNKGFEKGLEVVGVGYRAQKAGDKLVLQVGFTHPVEVVPPPGVSFLVEGTNRVKVCGVDKELVGDVAAKLRAIRKCDSYKGKGVKYAGEKIRLKPGKAGRAAAKK